MREKTEKIWFPSWRTNDQCVLKTSPSLDTDASPELDEAPLALALAVAKWEESFVPSPKTRPKTRRTR